MSKSLIFLNHTFSNIPFSWPFWALTLPGVFPDFVPLHFSEAISREDGGCWGFVGKCLTTSYPKEKIKVVICGLCQFLWCKYFYHSCWVQATDWLSLELGRNAFTASWGEWAPGTHWGLPSFLPLWEPVRWENHGKWGPFPRCLEESEREGRCLARRFVNFGLSD